VATRPERQITYDDYVTFPDEPRLEIIEGEAYVVPGSNTRHQEVAGRFFLRLGMFVEKNGGGKVFIPPFDVVLSDIDVVQPDIIFIADDVMDVLTDLNVRGTPSWVVEVLSPSHPERDRKLKLRRYETFKIPEYWIVDPVAEGVSVYRLDGDWYRRPEILHPPDVARPLQPDGFSLDLGDLFSR
jgi:Uma2 family endonuclease